MWLSFFINVLLVLAAVFIHYEVLTRIAALLPRLPIAAKPRLLVAALAALLAHVVEVWLFAVGYTVYLHIPGMGSLEGLVTGSWSDSVYFSFINYTSLGFGDIIPVGHIRFLAGIEALTGLVLIAWTASFLFFEIQKSWKSL